jgi:decaprenylphospho-beta-D-erythro-pentofuranosid-2-ulose 2-reductase
VSTDLLKGVPTALWPIPPEQAAADIARAMRQGRQTLFTPARWFWIMLLIRHLPSIIFRRLSF